MELDLKTKSGIIFKRMLNEDEIYRLKIAYETIKPQLLISDEITWINLFINGKKMLDFEHEDLFSKFVSNIVKEFFSNFKEVHVLSYGFIINPKKSIKSQQFHIDYTKTSSNIMIPLTYVTADNAIQFFDYDLPTTKASETLSHRDSIKILEDENVPFLEVKQIICKPFCVLQLLQNTLHRGISNAADYDRTMFFLTVDEVEFKLQETLKVNNNS